MIANGEGGAVKRVAENGSPVVEKHGRDFTQVGVEFGPVCGAESDEELCGIGFGDDDGEFAPVENVREGQIVIVGENNRDASKPNSLDEPGTDDSSALHVKAKL